MIDIITDFTLYKKRIMNNSIFHTHTHPTHSQISLALHQKKIRIISIFFHECSYPSLLFPKDGPVTF